MAPPERITFPGGAGAQLVGLLHRPETPARGNVLLAHCFTCGKDLHTSTRLARGLSGAGYMVLRFDFTGIGDSGGDFSTKTVTNNVRDVVAATLALVRLDAGPCAMVGHSLGGAAVLLAAQRLKTVRSLAVVGAPSSPEHVRGLIADAEEDIRRQGTATVTIAGRPFPISRQFLNDLTEHDQRQHVAALGRPLLVVHAVHDEVVHVSNGEEIFAAARQPKAFVPLPRSDHLLSDRRSAQRLVDVLTGWLDDTLPADTS